MNAPGKLIATLKDGISKSQATSMLSRHPELTLDNYMEAIGVVCLSCPVGEENGLIAKLSQEPEVFTVRQQVYLRPC